MKCLNGESLTKNSIFGHTKIYPCLEG